MYAGWLKINSKPQNALNTQNEDTGNYAIFEFKLRFHNLREDLLLKNYSLNPIHSVLSVYSVVKKLILNHRTHRIHRKNTGNHEAFGLNLCFRYLREDLLPKNYSTNNIHCFAIYASLRPCTLCNPWLKKSRPQNARMDSDSCEALILPNYLC